MTDKIKAALGQLDPANDAHWTATGLPAMKAVEELVGDTTITRADVETAWPGFARPTVSMDEETAGALQNRVPSLSLAQAALAAFDVHFGTGPRFDDADRAVLARPDITPEAFWLDHLRRNAPDQIHKRPWHMLSSSEKARIAIFMAVAA